MKFHSAFPPIASFALMFSMLGLTATAWADPPGRVARISYLGGEVSFAPAGEDSWYAARLNRPLVAGDRLWTGRGGRVELELGTAVVRLDEGSSFEFLNLDDEIAQIQLAEGTINLRVDHLHSGQVYEIDTPTLAFVANQPGEYRLDIAPYAESTQVTVFAGYADVYGEGGRNVQVQAGMSYRFFDPGLSDYERLVMPRPDDFDNWASARNDRYLNSPARNHVSTEMIGYADLDEYGSWRRVPDHGHVWFPYSVAPGWAPYRHGHWVWIDPWGWSWIDESPWGFAPFHYGRWIYAANGWGWIPGPRHVRPIYAPALVAFVGGSGWSLTVSSGGPPIGWFPLGPHDVYVPWYRVSRGYFGRVNVHNTVVINNTYVTNIYNDYYVQGRPLRRDYTFRNAVNAVTIVPSDSFVNARSVADSMTRLRPGALERGELLTGAPAAPTRASLTASATRAAPSTRAFERQVIARTKPASRAVSFETRQRAIARNGGEPLAVDQLSRLNASAAADRTGRVRIIGDEPATSATAGRTASASRAAGRDGLSNRNGAIRGVDAQPAPMVGAAPPRGRASMAPSVRTQAPAGTPAGETRSNDPRVIGNDTERRLRQRTLPPARYAPRAGTRTPETTPESRGIPIPPSRSSSGRQLGNESGNAREARSATPQRPATIRDGSGSATRNDSSPTPRVRTIEPRSERHAEPETRALPQNSMPIRSEPRAAPAPRAAIPQLSAPPTPVSPSHGSVRETAPSRAESRTTPAPRAAPQREAASERGNRDAGDSRHDRGNARVRSNERDR